MKILIVASNYTPEPTGISLYSTDLAVTLQKNGHDVTVITSLPHYPWWEIPTEHIHIKPGNSVLDDVEVIRFKHFIPRTFGLRNRYKYEISLFQGFNKSIRKLRGIDFNLIVAYVPSLASGLSAAKFSRKYKIPLGLIVQDITSAGAKELGIKGGNIISQLLRTIERSILVRSKSVVAISNEIAVWIKDLGIKDLDIAKIPNYSINEFDNIQKVQARKLLDWKPDDFIVMHTGNIGAKQSLMNLLNAAKNLEHVHDLKFIIVGHGNNHQEVYDFSQKLTNVAVIPPVSSDLYPIYLAASDILIVNERKSVTTMSLPSKLTSYLLSNRPILAAVSLNGSTSNYLTGIAKIVEPENPIQLSEAILTMRENPFECDQLSQEGLMFARKNLNSSIGRKSYVNWIENLGETTNM